MRILKNSPFYLTLSIAATVPPAVADNTPEAMMKELSDARAEIANMELTAAKLKADVEKLESVIKSDISHLDTSKEAKEEATHKCTATAKEVKRKLDEVAARVNAIAADVKALKERAAQERANSIELSTAGGARKSTRIEKGGANEKASGEETGEAEVARAKKPAARKKRAKQGTAAKKSEDGNNATAEALAMVEAALKEDRKTAETED